MTKLLNSIQFYFKSWFHVLGSAAWHTSSSQLKSIQIIWKYGDNCLGRNIIFPESWQNMRLIGKRAVFAIFLCTPVCPMRQTLSAELGRNTHGHLATRLLFCSLSWSLAAWVAFKAKGWAHTHCQQACWCRSADVWLFSLCYWNKLPALMSLLWTNLSNFDYYSVWGKLISFSLSADKKIGFYLSPAWTAALFFLSTSRDKSPLQTCWT